MTNKQFRCIIPTRKAFQKGYLKTQAPPGSVELIDFNSNNFDKIDIDLIDKYEINGDYVESQAFAFLAIRSVEGLPISFPSTTRCNEASTGGISVENY